MKLGLATVDLNVFDMGRFGFDGKYEAPGGLPPQGQLAAKALLREAEWTFYWYECYGPKEKTIRVDKDQKLVIAPPLIIYGKAGKGPDGQPTPPDRASKQATLDALVSVTGYSSASDMATALGKQMGTYAVKVPWARIKSAHTTNQRYEAIAEVDYRALRLNVAGAAIPGDIFLLLPMKVYFSTKVTGYCYEVEPIVEGPLRDDVYPEMHHGAQPIYLPGPTGKELQREEAKRRVQKIEEYQKKMREQNKREKDSALDELLEAANDAMIEQGHRDIDELMKY